MLPLDKSDTTPIFSNASIAQPQIKSPPSFQISKRRKSFLSLSLKIVLRALPLFCCTQCTPFYTWGYAAAIHPDATTAYIHAVMARENGRCAVAVDFYNQALSKTWSDAVAKERADAIRCANHEE